MTVDEALRSVTRLVAAEHEQQSSAWVLDRLQAALTRLPAPVTVWLEEADVAVLVGEVVIALVSEAPLPHLGAAARRRAAIAPDEVQGAGVHARQRRGNRAHGDARP